jgi:PhzF family phenazine biosynthesis protein
MPRPHRFHQVDVFTARPLAGNPLAVVHDAQDLDDARMAAFARWMNLSETVFLLPPRAPEADYRVRIFTPFTELPFAGHPTIGSAWAWLAAGGQPQDAGCVVQECDVGLVRVQRQRVTNAHGQAQDRLAFAAPPLRRTGPLEEPLLARVCAALRLPREDVLRHQWVDNGPGWLAVQLHSAEAVRAVQPDRVAIGELKIGLIGEHARGSGGSPEVNSTDPRFEVRAFFSGALEDPVTGSLNAGLAQWLMGAGLAPGRYVASQGHALGRDGRVHIERMGETIWVGGCVTPLVDGTVVL